jgi:hypothetical protein
LDIHERGPVCTEKPNGDIDAALFDGHPRVFVSRQRQLIEMFLSTRDLALDALAALERSDILLTLWNGCQCGRKGGDGG